jgi:Tfp pilus assembly protein PilN
MKPVNLIPPEDRRGDRAPARTGAIPYVIVAGLAVALLAVTAMVMFGNQVSERENTLATLEGQAAATSAQAEALQPYVEFDALASARQETVTSLAQSRFDWERVLRELALVIPDDVWLTDAVAAAAPASSAEATTDTSIAGPSMTLTGCGVSHEAVADFVAALRDIDGVTRIGISSSERPEGADDTSAAGGATDSGASADCRTRDMIAKFEIIAAFDGVPVVATGAEVAAPIDATAATPVGGEAE